MAVEKSDSKTAQAGADQAKVVKKTTKTGLKQTTDQATMALAQHWYGALNHAEGHQLRKRTAPAPPAAAAKKAKNTKKPAAKHWYGALNHAEGHQLRKRTAPAPPAAAAKKAKNTKKPAAKKAPKKAKPDA